MVELRNKRKFGEANVNILLMALTLYAKECGRFIKVGQQTILSPLVSISLFYIIFSVSIGNDRPNVLGVNFMTFLLPGLIAMNCLQASFAHSSSSILQGKIMQTIYPDLISTPLSATQVVLGIVLASVTRSFFIAIICIIGFSFFVDVKIHSYLYLIIFLFLGSFVLGCAGFLSGCAIEKFDGMTAISNFVLLPATMMSGTFFTIQILNPILQKICEFNPFWYMIMGTRMGFIGKADGSITIGIFYLLVISILLFICCIIAYQKGWKNLKN
tara:strand:- start:415 stop:1227 length:813 start_codon:yes stop_codon:yes gene_type:complete